MEHNIVRPFSSRNVRLPNRIRVAANLMQAGSKIIVQAIKTLNPVLVPDEVFRERETHCNGTDTVPPCPYLIVAEKRCSLCGCHTAGALVNKLKWAAMQCPAVPPRWLPYVPLGK